MQPTTSSNHPLLFQRAVQNADTAIQSALLNRYGISCQGLRSIHGKLRWIASKHNKAGKLSLNQISQYLERFKPSLKHKAGLYLKQKPPKDVERELAAWQKFLAGKPSLPLQKAPSTDHSVLLGDFTSDASSFGVGVTYDSQLYGYWKIRAGFWQEIGKDIEILELIGVEMLVRSLVSMGQRNVTVSCRCDNTNVCDLLEASERHDEKATENPFKKSCLTRLQQLLDTNSIQLQCTWIPTEQNLSDHISRGKPTDLKRLPLYEMIYTPDGLEKAGFLGREEVIQAKKKRLLEIQSQRRAMKSPFSPFRVRVSPRSRLITSGGQKCASGYYRSFQSSPLAIASSKVFVDLTISDEEDGFINEDGNENRPIDLTTDSDAEQEEISPTKGKGKGKARLQEIVDSDDSVVELGSPQERKQSNLSDTLSDTLIDPLHPEMYSDQGLGLEDKSTNRKRKRSFNSSPS